MLFSDASVILTLDGVQTTSIILFRSVGKGSLSPSLYVLGAEAFGYLLANKASQKLVKGISLPGNSGQLINGHFANYSFLNLREDRNYANQAYEYLDTLCKALGSSIQWKKTSYYRQS